jgi:hypothetical protein
VSRSGRIRILANHNGKAARLKAAAAKGNLSAARIYPRDAKLS